MSLLPASINLLHGSYYTINASINKNPHIDITLEARMLLPGYTRILQD